MTNRQYKFAVSTLFLIIMLGGCGEKASLKIENDSANEMLVTAVSINGKNVLLASKKLPPRNNRHSPEGHISEAEFSGKENLSIEVSVNGKPFISTCQIPELIGEGSCYLVFAHFNGTESMNCTYLCEDLSEGI
jgi:hypothetical protein